MGRFWEKQFFSFFRAPYNFFWTPKPYLMFKFWNKLSWTNPSFFSAGFVISGVPFQFVNGAIFDFSYEVQVLFQVTHNLLCKIHILHQQSLGLWLVPSSKPWLPLMINILESCLKYYVNLITFSFFIFNRLSFNSLIKGFLLAATALIVKNIGPSAINSSDDILNVFFTLKNHSVLLIPVWLRIENVKDLRSCRT